MPSEDYDSSLLGHAVPEEKRRLELLEETLDPISQTHLAACRIGEDWRCLDVGAGNGSIARWLSGRCPRGEIVASDIDTRFLPGPRSETRIKVIQHDVLTDNFPPESFDLIHTRALLVHTPERDDILHRMTSWVKPGGLLVIEEPFFIGHEDSEHPVFRHLMRAMEQILRDIAGTDMRWAHGLSQHLHSLELRIEAKTLSPLICGHTSPVDRLWHATVTQLRPGFLSSGLLPGDEIDAFLDLLNRPEFLEIVFCLSSITARRPA